MLTVGLAADSLEVVTMYNSLETLTLRCTDDVNERCSLEIDVCYCDDIAKLELTLEVVLELDELLLRSGSSLVKMALQGRGGLLFFLFVIGKLNC